MPSSLASKKEPLVGMGQTSIAAKPDCIRSVLGSCIGLGLYHARCGVGALAHVVLPASEGRAGPPAKFADTVLPFMLEELLGMQANRAGLVAKLTGGANMFAASGPMQIGKANVDAVRAALAEHRIPIVGEHVGGQKGRRVTFDICTGEITVEIAGEPCAVI